ncbi:hypothetical protein L218DRAFT_1008138 [Marasmius fiardii PR-910]|nr:hypothetical protein L218DRAFT_1008138 [Marasmius fiardii PR-910]
MVCLLLAPFVSLLFIGAALTTPLNKRDIADIQGAINTTSFWFTILGNTTTTFPNSTDPLATALYIRNVMVDTGDSLQSGQDALDTTGSFNETGGPVILDSVEALQPTVINALQALINNKATFQGLPEGAGLVKDILQDLQDLRRKDDGFLDSVHSASQPNFEDRATNVTTPIYAAFDTVINAYATNS